MALASDRFPSPGALVTGPTQSPAKRGLTACLARKLGDLGVAVETVSDDTCADESRFFSYRRATQCREKDYGRGLAAIVLSDNTKDR